MLFAAGEGLNQVEGTKGRKKVDREGGDGQVEGKKLDYNVLCQSQGTYGTTTRLGFRT